MCSGIPVRTVRGLRELRQRLGNLVRAPLLPAAAGRNLGNPARSPLELRCHLVPTLLTLGHRGGISSARTRNTPCARRRGNPACTRPLSPRRRVREVHPASPCGRHRAHRVARYVLTDYPRCRLLRCVLTMKRKKGGEGSVSVRAMTYPVKNGKNLDFDSASFRCDRRRILCESKCETFIH